MSTAKPLTPQGVVTNNLLDVMARLWNSGDSSDVTIVCGPEVFKVHSFVLGPNSKFFEAACGGGFKEAQTKRIELPDDNPAMIKRMLQFCYGMTYSFSPGYDENPDAIYNPHCHAAMYALAEKYEIEGLKTIARINFTNGMKLGMACKAGIPSISTLVPLVYTGTPESDRTLRDELVNYSQKKWELIDVVERKAALHNPEFAFDMIDSKPVVPPPPMYERYCERCCVTSS